MCGRYSLISSLEALKALFGFEGELPDLAPSYNIAPGRGVPIVRLEEGGRRLAMVRWGLVPSWSRGIGARPLFNARGETVSVKPSFRAAFRRRRCLVPADGYFEWQARRDAAKQPYNIVAAQGGPFAMAGVWERWMSAEGSELDSMAVITVPANKGLSPIHDRMPLIIQPKDFSLWLDCRDGSIGTALSLIHPAPEELMNAYPVSSRVNNAGYDDPSVLAPVTGVPEQSRLL